MFFAPETKGVRLVRTPTQFDMFQNSAKQELDKELIHQPRIILNIKQTEGKTGWLPGPLSYPWVFIVMGIPHLIHSFIM